ncbi:hypothetical protein [Nostoc commune]|nr:hypothetical protein [Nostoc commune]
MQAKGGSDRLWFVNAIAFSIAPIRKVKILTSQTTCTLLRNLLRFS